MYVPFFIRRINYDDGRDSDFDEPESVVRSKVGRFSDASVLLIQLVQVIHPSCLMKTVR